MAYRDKPTIEAEPKEPAIERLAAWLRRFEMLPDWFAIPAVIASGFVVILSTAGIVVAVQHWINARWPDPPPLCVEQMFPIGWVHDAPKCTPGASLTMENGQAVCHCPK